MIPTLKQSFHYTFKIILISFRRRGSFQSSRSVPALTLEGRASGRSTKSESSKLRRNKNDKNGKKGKTHSEVGIRTVHTAYKAHHGFLALLKQRFSRSSSRDRDGLGTGITAETSQSANATPEASRRPLTVDRVGPEIVRIRNDNSESSNHSEVPQSSVEIFRHCATSVESSTAAASGAHVSVAEVVRHKLHALTDHVRDDQRFENLKNWKVCYYNARCLILT
jgi:hypothetical protein